MLDNDHPCHAKRSATMPKRGEKKVLVSGICTCQPSVSALNRWSALGFIGDRQRQRNALETWLALASIKRASHHGNAVSGLGASRNRRFESAFLHRRVGCELGLCKRRLVKLTLEKIGHAHRD
jgi:hypothetical protein